GGVMLLAWWLVTLSLSQPDLLIGASVEEMGNQSKTRFCHTRANAIGPDEFVERGIQRPLVHQPLDLVQEHLALLAVPFQRLLFVQCVDIRVAAAGKFTPTRDIGLQTGGGITQGAAATRGQSSESLLA